MDSLTYESMLCVKSVCICSTGCLLLAFCTKAHDVCVERSHGMTILVCVFVSRTAAESTCNFQQHCLHYISLGRINVYSGNNQQTNTKANV